MTSVASAGLSRFRLAIAYLAIGAIVAGSVYDILMRQEHWPFSNYPMFAEIHRSQTLRWPRLYGVTAEGREVPVVAYRELYPLDQSRLLIGLRELESQSGSDARVHAALQDVLRRYEMRRNQGLHRGPPLVALRLYQLSWQIEPFAANLDRPDDRQLLASATLDQ